MATDPRDPDPSRTSGLEKGGGVRPGDTPPASDQLSGATSGQGRAASRPSSGRGPMIVALVFVALVVVSVLVYGVAQVSSYLSDDPVSSQTGSSSG